MSKVLTQQEMEALLNSGSVQTTSAAQEPQQGASEAQRARPRGGVPASSICLANRPQMAPGWLNTEEGILWNWNRVNAFCKMSAGRMTYGSLKKQRESD